MTRLIRKRIAALGIAALVVITAAFALTAFSSRIIKAYIEEESDRFKIDEISFGWGAIEGRGVRILSNGQEVARAKLVRLQPSLLTLFRKGFTLSSILVEEPTLTISITETNRLTTPFGAGKAGETTSQPQPFHVGLLEIKNGILTINDQRPGKPAQLQIHNLNLVVGSFSHPLSDESSTVQCSGQLSGKILSGFISVSGTVNLKTHAARLSCTAQEMNALQRVSQTTPQLYVQKLSFKAESSGSGPILLSDALIEKPYHKYATEQKREISRALPEFGNVEKPEQDTSKQRIAFIKGVTVKSGEVVVTDSARKNQSSFSVVNLSLSIDQLALPLDNTPSFFDLSGDIPGRQNTASLRWSGTTSFGNLETDSRLSLQSLDLTSLRPYLEKKGEATITRGTVDIGAQVRVRDRFLDTPVTATIRHLELAPASSLGDRFMGVPRSLLLSTLKTSNDEIQIDFIVSGSLDNPTFSVKENMTKRFAVALARSLGLSSVVGAGETVVEQGARAVQGAGKGIKGFGEGVKRLLTR